MVRSFGGGGGGWNDSWESVTLRQQEHQQQQQQYQKADHHHRKQSLRYKQMEVLQKQRRSSGDIGFSNSSSIISYAGKAIGWSAKCIGDDDHVSRCGPQLWLDAAAAAAAVAKTNWLATERTRIGLNLHCWGVTKLVVRRRRLPRHRKLFVLLIRLVNCARSLSLILQLSFLFQFLFSENELLLFWQHYFTSTIVDILLNCIGEQAQNTALPA